MHYTQLFRTLREAKGLTLDQMSRLSRRHRNTVLNVEAGRPVKFKTLSQLVVKMGYAPNSPEMRSMALLWLESISGMPFSHFETENSTRKAIVNLRSPTRQAARRLEETVTRAGLTSDEVSLLVFAAQHPEALVILEKVRELASTLASDSAAELKVAEDD